MNKYIQNYTITNDCMDINYRLKPVEILMYFQDNFARYLTSKKIGAFDIVKEDLYWVISEINVEIVDNISHSITIRNEVFVVIESSAGVTRKCFNIVMECSIVIT